MAFSNLEKVLATLKFVLKCHEELFETNFKEKYPIMEALSNFDSKRFSMLEILYKNEIYEMLKKNNCKLFSLTENNGFTLNLFSEKFENLKICKREINDLYYSNILLSYNNQEDITTWKYLENIIFIRDGDRTCTLFGNFEKILKNNSKFKNFVGECNFNVDCEMGRVYKLLLASLLAFLLLAHPPALLLLHCYLHLYLHCFLHLYLHYCYLLHYRIPPL